MATRALTEIQIGRRHRLLHPIVIRPDCRVIAGARRYEAVKSLAWDKVAVTVIDLDKVVTGEYAENFFRKAFTPSEMVEITRALEPIEQAKAKQRQRATAAERGKQGGRGRRKASGEIPHKLSRKRA